MTESNTHLDPNQEFKQILFNVKFKDFKRLNKYINIKNNNSPSKKAS